MVRHEIACDADAASPNQSQSAVDVVSRRPNQPQNNKNVCLLVLIHDCSLCLAVHTSKEHIVC